MIIFHPYIRFLSKILEQKMLIIPKCHFSLNIQYFYTTIHIFSNHSYLETLYIIYSLIFPNYSSNHFYILHYKKRSHVFLRSLSKQQISNRFSYMIFKLYHFYKFIARNTFVIDFIISFNNTFQFLSPVQISIYLIVQKNNS